MSKKKIIVKQHDLTDCGPACLSSIIRYYGGYVPIEMIRFDCNTGINGTSIYNLIKASKKYGFTAKALKVNNILDLNSNVDYPLIAHVKLKNNFNHFVVIYEMAKDSLIVMDPHIGRCKLKINEFTEIFSNIIVIFRPLRKITCLNKPKYIFSVFLNFIFKRKKDTLILLLSSALVIILALISSYYIKICSFYTLNASFKNFLSCSIIFFVIYIFKNLINYMKNNRLINYSKCINQKLYYWFINKIYNLPLNFIKSRTTGEIVSRFNELYEINDFLSQIIIIFTLDLLMFIVAFIFLSLISFKLSLLILVIIGVYVLISIIFKNPTLKKISSNIDLSTEFNSEIINNISVMISTKYLNNENLMKKRLKNNCNNFLEDSLRLNRFLNFQDLFKDLVYDLGIFLLCFYGLYLNYINNLSITNLFTFIIIANYLIEPVKEIIGFIPKFSFVKSLIYKLNEFCLINENSQGTYLFRNGKIHIKDLSFSYNDLDLIIDKFSLDINQADKILINGNSGCGKSTLCQIISGQLCYNSGVIKIGNHDLNEIKSSDLRRNVTYIGQKDSLYVDTIINNIKCERTVSDKELMAVCKICEIDKIVQKKYDQFDTIINESNANISGGEKQRIILARGLINSGDILILDESLSEVDIKTEERIIKNIFTYFKNKTILYVSHKSYNNLFTKIVTMK